MKHRGFWSVCFLTAMFLCTGCERRQAMEIYEETVSEEIEEAFDTEKESMEADIFVDVRGAVEAPGVYTLPKGSRVFAAIEAAGGLLPDAAVRAINQAALLDDGEQLYIPREGEEGDDSVPTMETELRVNINTADAKELTTLPGIGESRALDIIAYREANGGFSSVEDIMKVSGIKDALFQKIKDKIKI